MSTKTVSTATGPLAPSNPQTKEDTALWSLRHVQILWSWAAKPSKPKYPPISSIPSTPASRLLEPDAVPTTGEPFPTEPILTKNAHHGPSKANTVLYLAYGSNMCAKTFLGMRGIRPLSQINVSAPSLDLTFDLPGLPYREPCFANTALRKLPEPPKLPPKVPGDLPDLPKLPPFSSSRDDSPRKPITWTKGLIGVVYEVTAEDYAKIITTEGGGASYHDILVPCLPLPPAIGVPEKPDIPLPPKPFLARTLYAPRLPDIPDDKPPSEENDDGDDGRPKPEPPSWFQKLLLPARRPQSDYAQPSPRYLGLLITGAAEHDLPQEYQAYLQSLQPYTATTSLQKVGQVLFLGFWAPVFLTVMFGGRLFGDEKGKAPRWVVVGTTVLFNLVWASYDYIAKPIFGEGERTMEEEERGRGWCSEWWGSMRKERGTEEERRVFLA
ncbi:hypothetical protein QBC40DRAFT_342364 [Triangularia verruculosa]|uniref:gamma-glutamylcyclotransferase n=1 Tax=Triangularia verruculosa TaxID=2587418 RepID=A0AAN6XAL2_9PEZI|nr:hypothetical protein QBC40DRAFT_342364 [Triangularia verruculosa]